MKKKIMIVEDEILIAMSVAKELSLAGYEVSELCSSGREALLNIAQEKPDVILMDVSLEGDLDGIETAGRIQADYKVPIIFLTGYADEELFARAKLITPVEIITKPAEIVDILAAIEAATCPDK